MPTLLAIAARPHPLVRREHAPESSRDPVAAAGRYMPSPLAFIVVIVMDAMQSKGVARSACFRKEIEVLKA